MIELFNKLEFKERTFQENSNLNYDRPLGGMDGACPNDQVAFIGISGEPQTCAIGQSTCPNGFSCQRTMNGLQICCTTGVTSKFILICVY
jgi:hypothetical protein